MKKTLLPALFVLGSFALTETAAAQGTVLVKWPLTANNQATQPATGVTPGTPVFRRLTLSNNVLPVGTGNMAFAPYSAAGQAFAVNADGGGWSSNATPPGPGSSPRRRFFEQFSITATQAIRVDSLLYNVGSFNTSAAKTTAVYSTSGFTTDSSDIAPGGIGPVISNANITRPGGVLPPNENGTFGVSPATMMAGDQSVNGALLPQFSTGVPPGSIADQYRFLLKAGGVTLAAGRTLTVRLYFGAGSSSVGRYMLLRNVTLKGSNVLATRTGVETTLQAYPNPAQNQVVVPHTALGQDARITVYNAVGAQVASAVAKAGSSQTTVSLQALAAGLYLVEYANGTERSSARVVKE